MRTPTERSLKDMRGRGFTVAVVEHWNSFTRRRQDLYGVIDLLGVSEAGTLAVQTTSGGEVARRKAKILASDTIRPMLQAGWTVEVHGWRKVKKKRGGKAMVWAVRIVQITLADLEQPELQCKLAE